MGLQGTIVGLGSAALAATDVVAAQPKVLQRPIHCSHRVTGATIGLIEWAAS
jgi:hypothetical protein